MQNQFSGHLFHIFAPRSVVAVQKWNCKSNGIRKFQCEKCTPKWFEVHFYSVSLSPSAFRPRMPAAVLAAGNYGICAKKGEESTGKRLSIMVGRVLGKDSVPFVASNDSTDSASH